MEDMNMMPINIERFTKLIREQMEDEDYTPLLGLGKSGVGKTESIYGLTQELGIGFCELRLVTMTETDMLGIPMINEHNRTDWASNNLLPDAKRDGERGILVLDEITSCSSTIRAAAYQLLDSKRALGNYKLPEKWLVVGLGNAMGDGGVYQGLEQAFMNRCRCFRIDPDLAVWKRHAVKSGVNPSVIAFLSFAPEYLHHMDADEIASVFPSPRSWFSLSKKLNDRERRNDGKPLDSDSVDIYAACCIGNDVASRFAAFYNYNRSVVETEDILSGKASGKIANLDMQVMYIIVQNLVKGIRTELKNNTTADGSFTEQSKKRVGNACRWLIELGSMSLDLAVMGLQDIGANVPEFQSCVMDADFDDICPEFLEFATANSLIFS